MSDASKTTSSAAGSAADSEVDGKATPPKPKYTIPRKPVADTPSPSNVNVNEDRASRDRGEAGVDQLTRSGQLAPTQLDQSMAQRDRSRRS